MGGFEGGIRVPALISYPRAGWTGGRALEQATSMMDVYPTIIKQFFLRIAILWMADLSTPQNEHDFLGLLYRSHSTLFYLEVEGVLEVGHQLNVVELDPVWWM